VDGASRLFRIGRIIAAVLVLGAACLAITYALERFFEGRAANLLSARGTEILRRNKSSSAIVPLRDLFGNDIDGVCIVWNGPVDEAAMRDGSAANFSPVISTIAKMQARDSVEDSDTRYWVVHAVKGAAVIKSYNLVARSVVDLYRTDIPSDGVTREPVDRCFDRNAPAQLNLYSEQSGEGKSLIIKVPAAPPAAIQ
jgi:hypothetical protein